MKGFMKFKKEYIGSAMEDLMTHLILETMTDEHTESIQNNKDYVEFTCQLNGIELNPKNFFKHMNEEFQRMITEKAIEMLNNKFSKLMYSIQDIQSEVEGNLRTKLLEETNEV